MGGEKGFILPLLSPHEKQGAPYEGQKERSLCIQLQRLLTIIICNQLQRLTSIPIAACSPWTNNTDAEYTNALYHATKLHRVAL